MIATQTATIEPANPTRLRIVGMTCQNCARHVGEALQSTEGVDRVVVRLERGEAELRWKEGILPAPDKAVTAVKSAGYDAVEIEDKDAAGGATANVAGPMALSGWGLNVLVGGIGTLGILLVEALGGGTHPAWTAYAAFGLALPVQGIAGARFYLGAWMQLKAGRSNMDTLVALGSTTAFLYSLWAMAFMPHAHLYFMEAAAIITLISVGHWIESTMTARAAGAVRQLLELTPPTALRFTENGKAVEVPLAALLPGDRLELRPGSRIPTDGIVRDGSGAIDESMLTGEAMPVEKKPGDNIYGGTLCIDQLLVMEVTAVGHETALAHITEAVERAQSSRANIQRLADRVSSVFVPIVVLIALGTAAWWGFAPEWARRVATSMSGWLWMVHLPDTALAGAIIHAAGVLIIACPCAMGLATPAALMAGANLGAKRGILIRDGVALEKAGTIQAVVFDKTGTLTVGKPQLVKVVPVASGWTEDGVRELAAALAAPSNHPLSRAIAGAATGKKTLTGWRETRGCGVQGTLTVAGMGSLARLGALSWFEREGIDVSAANDRVATGIPADATSVGLAVGKKVVGVVALSDSLKAGVPAMVARLKKWGLKVYLVTGDTEGSARAMAERAGIEASNVIWQVRPEEKAREIERLQKTMRVAFVGDGLNDGPALEQADLGIAVGKATDVAKASADLLLLRTDVESVPEAIGMARATLRTIRQNLFWAFFYNAMAVPLAALGFVSPIICAAAMGLSDVVVIGNALRLRHWKLKPED